MSDQPTRQDIDDTLSAIAATESPDDAPLHPRVRARLLISQWKSNAERQQLPTTNEHDDKGAPLLDVRRVLGYDDHDRRLGRK